MSIKLTAVEQERLRNPCVYWEARAFFSVHKRRGRCTRLNGCTCLRVGQLQKKAGQPIKTPEGYEKQR